MPEGGWTDRPKGPRPQLLVLLGLICALLTTASIVPVHWALIYSLIQSYRPWDKTSTSGDELMFPALMFPEFAISLLGLFLNLPIFGFVFVFVLPFLYAERRRWQMGPIRPLPLIIGTGIAMVVASASVLVSTFGSLLLFPYLLLPNLFIGLPVVYLAIRLFNRPLQADPTPLPPNPPIG